MRVISKHMTHNICRIAMFIYTKDGLQYHFVDGYVEVNDVSYLHYFIKDLFLCLFRGCRNFDGPIAHLSKLLPLQPLPLRLLKSAR